MAGVGEALQSMHQNRTAAVGRRQLRRRELKLVHAGRPWLVVLIVLIVIVVWALMAGHRDFLLSGVSPECPNKCPPYQWGPIMNLRTRGPSVFETRQRGNVIRTQKCP